MTLPAKTRPNVQIVRQPTVQWIKQKEIQRVRTTDTITFPEARTIVDARFSNATTGPSYETVTTITKIAAMPSTRFVSCQTDNSWLAYTDTQTLLKVLNKPPKAVAITSATQSHAPEIKDTA